MSEFVDALGGWTWWIIAGLLLLVELASPGIFFLWLGLAAAALGVIVLIVDINWLWQVALWAVLSVVFVMVAKPWLKRRNELASDQPYLNRRMLNYVGKSYVLDEAIVNGRGKIRIDDTLWEASGPDTPKGHWVKVLRAEGLGLIVEPSEQPVSR